MARGIGIHLGRTEGGRVRIPEGVKVSKGLWGTNYSYKGIQIARGAGRYSTRYDFKIEGKRIMASTLAEAVREIEKEVGA